MLVNWSSSGGLNAALGFYAPLTTSLALATSGGSSTPTFTRATTKTFTDWEGRVRTAIAGEACFTGARRVRNAFTFTEDFTNAAWTKSNATVTANAGVAPDGTSTATRLLGTGGTAWFLSQSVMVVGATGTLSCYIKSNTGTNQPLKLNLGSAAVAAITATPAWQRFSFTVAVAGSAAAALLHDTTQACDVLIWHPQTEDVTGQSNQNPSEYVSVGVLSAPFQGAGVDGVQYFATQNGNTVASNVVTAGTGAAIASSVLLGYSAWQAATNLCLQSEDIGTTWTNNALANSLNATAAPSGATVADLLKEDATTAQHFNNQAFVKAASALAYTASLHVKAQSARNIALQLDDGTNGTYCVVNPSTGAVVTASTNVGTGFTSPSVTVETLGSGWYRIKFTATSTTSTAINFKAVLCNGANTNSYAGDNASGVYVWGDQLEQNAFATPYIATTVAAVTRNADTLNYPNTGNVANDGAAYAEINPGTTAGAANPRIIATNDDLDAPLILAAGGQPRVYDGVTFATSGLGTVSAGATSKIGSSWSVAALTMKAFLAGTAGGAQAYDGTMLGAGTTVRIGSKATAADQFNGNIRNVKIFRRTLTDAQLVALTS